MLGSSLLVVSFPRIRLMKLSVIQTASQIVEDSIPCTWASNSFLKLSVPELLPRLFLAPI